MAIKTITQKWIINNLLIISAVLITMEIVIILSVQNYYEQNARQTLKSSANVMTNLIETYDSDSTKNVSSEIRNLVQNFNEKETMELMAITHQGKVSITSSGFPTVENISLPDYEEAMMNSTGESFYKGKSALGEDIISYTVLVPSTNTEYSALRFAVSLKGVNSMILRLTVVITIIVLLILVLVVASGIFFVNSIVIPVRQVGNVASKIASGDLNARIIKRSDDEIGHLCETINHMADELENTENMKNEFISSVSHELRTPLTAIKGWSETIMVTGSDDVDTLKKGMKVITGETERLSRMVEELLDFSRIQSGRFSLQSTKLDILAELGEAILIFGERARSEEKTIRYEEPDMLPAINGDRNRLKQVFVNVIDNAIKYSEKGDVIAIKAEAVNDSVVITIMDTGCGIAKDDLPHVTEKFYKANHSKRGSGIGLAVASEIIENHGGNMIVDSEEGVGTLVTIELPIYKEPSTDDTGKSSNTESSE